MSDIFVRNNGTGSQGVVGIMRGRASEIVETLARRRIDICAVQETRWRGCSTRMITGKHCRYKFLWSDDNLVLGVLVSWLQKNG